MEVTVSEIKQPGQSSEWEEPACDLCGSTSHEFVMTSPDRMLGYPGQFTFVRCGTCGLLYQSPRLQWSSLAGYYEGGYPSHGEIVQDEPSPIKRIIKRLGPLKQRRYIERFRKGGALLDVGCGTGIFLAEMQHASTWTLTGLEPTPTAAGYVRHKLGIPVVEEVFEETTLPDGSQDVITMWHVLEHLMSPTRALATAHRLLRPQGFLVVAIPNFESLGRRLWGRFWLGWELPRHLFAFPAPVLRRMMAEQGFRVVDQKCFLISYDALGHSLTFWLQSWPPRLQPLAKFVGRAYYTPVVRLLLYPAQRLVEWAGLSTVATWTVQKVDSDDGA